MRIDILTLFPGMFSGAFDESIVGRAQKQGKVEIKIHQLRDWSTDRHQTVDDRPFGGGVGMLLKIEPIYEALKELKSKIKSDPLREASQIGFKNQIRSNRIQKSKTILLDAGGSRYTQSKARELSKAEHIILICGRYEGVDHRIREHLIDEEISIGDYILTGGEIPAMVIADSVTRLIPGVLTKEEAVQLESFSLPTTDDLQVEYPQYTRPENFKGWKVPEVLLSGNHKKIEWWKKEESNKRSKKR
ncbi:MAG: tRNA (guanine37-N1)-methyltransferase [Microgenomates group bacterium Gr01-1014_5]|nr:MAG: tRNA (guanine37-N1)-methyltransferase [Microgenomates group bacterium Gr01-1014_5]